VVLSMCLHFMLPLHAATSRVLIKCRIWPWDIELDTLGTTLRLVEIEQAPADEPNDEFAFGTMVFHSNQAKGPSIEGSRIASCAA
jgi:hypothetical protein